MTPTAEDLAFALAALDAGLTPYQSWHELWNTEHDDEVLTFGHPSPLIALAAAGRALKLQPKWVVVPVEDVLNAGATAVINALSRKFARSLLDLDERLFPLSSAALSSTPSKDGDTT